MTALSKRLDKLLTPLSYLERPFVGIVCNHGESDEDAITRHGYNPEDASVRFVIIRGVPAPSASARTATTSSDKVKQ